jgi:regulator of protease activity HflC (stomatin/prohibitin superfamily)
LSRRPQKLSSKSYSQPAGRLYPQLCTPFERSQQPEAAQIGINVFAVEVKDVMFAAELKRAFADVLKAKQEG